jgi:hypothetical protein
MKIYVTSLITFCLGFMLQARQSQGWSYDMLNEHATLIVIATPTTVAVTTERTNLLGDISVKGVETSFEVLTVLKGDNKFMPCILHHFALVDPKDVKAQNAGLKLVSFEPKDRKIYLLFLQQEADGRYVAVSGQTDPFWSVTEFTGQPANLLHPDLDHLKGGPF